MTSCGFLSSMSLQPFVFNRQLSASLFRSAMSSQANNIEMKIKLYAKQNMLMSIAKLLIMRILNLMIQTSAMMKEKGFIKKIN